MYTHRTGKDLFHRLCVRWCDGRAVRLGLDTETGGRASLLEQLATALEESAAASSSQAAALPTQSNMTTRAREDERYTRDIPVVHANNAQTTPPQTVTPHGILRGVPGTPAAAGGENNVRWRQDGDLAVTALLGSFNQSAKG